MMRDSLAVHLAEAVIEASQWTAFKGRGGYGATPNQLACEDRSLRYAQGLAEQANVGGFYAHFPSSLPEALAGRRVLDFGCGYGGKTVAYAEHAAFVAGIEPFENMIELAKGFAAGVPNVEFKVCPEDRVPYPDASFDVVVSHDVLEHVANPATSLREIARVLKPGGVAYLVFPPYDGMFSHHLDYVSLAPALHWMFSATTLVGAVNRVQARRNIGVARQPPPKTSWNGRRPVLPQLNGLTGREFEVLAEEHFASREVRYELVGHDRRHPFVRLIRDGVLAPAARLGLRDAVTLSISATLRLAD
jgi:SAM-dependent methyltransferase